MTGATMSPYMEWVRKVSREPRKRWRLLIAARLRALGYRRGTRVGRGLFDVMLDDIDTYRYQGYLTKLPASLFTSGRSDLDGLR